MAFWQLTLEALRSLRANRLRSALAILGVIIGITSVVMMMATGDWMRAFIDKELSRLGRNQLLVFPAAATEGAVRTSGKRPALTLGDAEAIAQLPSVKLAAAEIRGFVQAHFGSDNENLSVLGVTPEMLSLKNWPVEQGVSFDNNDVRSGKRVLLIGAKLAKKYYAGRDPIGQSVRLDGRPYTVIGVLATEGQGLNGNDEGELMLVPITAAPSRERLLPGVVNALTVQGREGAAMSDVEMDVAELLRDRHRITGDREDDFRTIDLAGIAKAGASIAKGLQLGMGLIGAIALIVGGIGIMNIMLVSVSERVREIGIRMAIGAKPRDVLAQFLVEAVVLCILGGLAGLGLAWGAAAAISHFAHFDMPLAVRHMVVAVSFAASVGLFFGYYPARRASKLLPIECLRQD